jgi:hypothetical protein
MSILESAGRARRAAGFATIKAAFCRRKKYLARAHDREREVELRTFNREKPGGAIAAGIIPLRCLQAIMDRAEVIAIGLGENSKCPSPGNVAAMVARLRRGSGGVRRRRRG